LKSAEVFFFNNPLAKFVFMKDEDRITIKLYVPTLRYNSHDGLSPGMRLHNKTILDGQAFCRRGPAFNKCKTFSGSGFVVVIGIMEMAPSTRATPFYGAGMPDAACLKISPMVQLSIREKSIQDNQFISPN
jgi:hypothetical protein